MGTRLSIRAEWILLWLQWDIWLQLLRTAVPRSRPPSSYSQANSCACVSHRQTNSCAYSQAYHSSTRHCSCGDTSTSPCSCGDTGTGFCSCGANSASSFSHSCTRQCPCHYTRTCHCSSGDAIASSLSHCFTHQCPCCNNSTSSGSNPCASQWSSRDTIASSFSHKCSCHWVNSHSESVFGRRRCIIAVQCLPSSTPVATTTRANARPKVEHLRAHF